MAVVVATMLPHTLTSQMLTAASRMSHADDDAGKNVAEFVHKTYAKYDANGDGVLEYSEFLEAAKSDTEICSYFTLALISSSVSS
jgi:hypothetical protein